MSDHQWDEVPEPPQPEPAQYTRQEDFNDYKQDSSLPASALENEFDRIDKALAETQSRLRMIQRSDGELRNESVHADALSPETTNDLKKIRDDAQAILEDIEEIDADLDAVKKARDWASREPGEEVEDGLYSARHYADEAAKALDAISDDLIADGSIADYLVWSSYKVDQELQKVRDDIADARDKIGSEASEAEKNAKDYAKDYADDVAKTKADQAEQNAKDYIDDETVRQTQDNELSGVNTFKEPAYFEKGYYEPKYIGWNARTDGYVGNFGPTATHENMRRCVMDDNGQVVYYLDPHDSSYKEDGEEADLEGGDGQVMVEIPKFWIKTEFRGDWQYRYVSPIELDGYEVHPAFKPVIDGEEQEVDYIYVGAFGGAVFSASNDEWIDGLNQDDNTDRVGLSGDHLGSVKGTFPMVGLQRSEFRTLAGNLGDGKFHLWDFWTVQALQLLYLVEYGDHNSQVKVGRGNVDKDYPSSSDSQSDSPHVESGLSVDIGDDSGSVDDDAGDPWVSYRGVEHFWGNAQEWVDGFNIDDRQAYVANAPLEYEDDTSSSPYESIGDSMPDANGDYIERWQEVERAFIPAATGASSSSGVTDQLWTDNGWRVAHVGGNASHGDRAGAFCWRLGRDSGHRGRYRGARVARRVPASEE